MPQRTLSRLAILVALTLPLLLGAAPLPRTVETSQFWMNPVPLTEPYNFAWFPDVIADATGQVTVVWSSNNALGVNQVYDTVEITSSGDGIRWDTPNDIVAQTTQGSATRPTLLVDRLGMLHMTYRFYSIYYTNAAIGSRMDARAWSPPEQINAFQTAYFSRIAVDSKGNLHLVYTENTPSGSCPLCYRLYYRHSADNGVTWSPAADISQIVSGAAKPQILIDDQDQIHVVWEAGRGGDLGQLENDTQVLYTVSRDGGSTWESPHTFSAAGQKIAKNISLGLDGAGNLVAAWLSLPADKIYYASSKSAGRSWSEAKAVEGVWGGFSVYQARTDDYAMATDSAGHIQLVFVGRTKPDQEDLSLINIVWSGKEWSKPLVIVTPKQTVPEWPRLAVGSGDRLHVVWFERDKANLWNSDAGQYRVWYAQGVADAPHLSPQTYPSPTLTQVTPTSIPAATSTSQPPLPTPTHPQLTRGPEPQSRPDSELDYVILLAKALVPSLGLVLIALVFRQIRRR